MKPIILFFLYCLLLISCKSKTTVIENTTEKSKYDFQDQVSQSSVVIDRSLAIDDLFKQAVPQLKTGSIDKNCDSLCNLEFERWLRTLNTQKQSGDNGYKFFYNELTKQLELNVKIGETIDSYKDSLYKQRTEYRELELQKKEVPIKLPLTPLQKFFFYSGIILWLFLAYKLYKMLTLKSII